MSEQEIKPQKRPCKECPFSRACDVKYDAGGVVLFLGAVMSDEGQLCHMHNDDRDCEGARRFLEGGEGVFGSLSEMAQARARDSLAFEFFRQLERLMPKV